MYRLQINLWVAIILMIFSCDQFSNSSLDIFFSNLEKKVPSDKLYKFKEAPIDSAVYYFDFFFTEYQTAIQKEIDTSDEFSNHLNKLHLELSGLPDYLYLVYNFHAWLNNKAYSVNECLELYDSEQKVKLRNRNTIDSQALELILRERARWQIGDTLNFIFPSGNDYIRNEPREAILRLYPYSLEIYEFEDTLKLTGILKNKRLDSFELNFTIEVTETNNGPIIILGEKYQVGDELNLPIQTYGRPIE